MTMSKVDLSPPVHIFRQYDSGPVDYSIIDVYFTGRCELNTASVQYGPQISNKQNFSTTNCHSSGPPTWPQ